MCVCERACRTVDVCFCDACMSLCVCVGVCVSMYVCVLVCVCMCVKEMCVCPQQYTVSARD